MICLIMFSGKKKKKKKTRKNISKFRLLKILPSMLSVNALRIERNIYFILSHGLYALNKCMFLFIASEAGLHWTLRSDLRSAQIEYVF